MLLTATDLLILFTLSFCLFFFSLFVFCFFAEKPLPFVYRFHTNGRWSECRNFARKY